MLSRLLPAVTLCLFLAACSSTPSDQPEVAPVRGKVTKGGQPVAGANVIFSPVGEGRSATAVTDAAGNYELVYLRDIKGARVGENEVRITTQQEPEIADDGTPIGGRKEEMPPNYLNGAEKRTVEAGKENVIDFAIP